MGKKYWLWGGIIGLIICVILLALFVFGMFGMLGYCASCNGIHNGFQHISCPSGCGFFQIIGLILLIPFTPVALLLFYVLRLNDTNIYAYTIAIIWDLIIFFIIGAIIGCIIGKIKNRGKKK